MADIYGYSFDGERYNGRYDTREAALVAARDEAKSDHPSSCFTCRGVDVQPERYLPTGWDLIERVEEGIADNHAVEDPIFNVGTEQRVDLESRIERAFLEWMRENPNAWRTYYEAHDVQEHDLSAVAVASQDSGQ